MAKESDLSDAQVVERVLAGRTEAFETLVERHMAVVTGLAYAQIGNRSDAEDAAQETFLQAFCGLDTLRDGRKLLPWLAGITRNVCSAQIRTKIRERKTAQRTEFKQESVEPDCSTAELHSLVRAQVRQLELPDQEVLILHYFAGKSTREMAAILDISRHAAKKRLERARDRLALEITESLGQAFEPTRTAKDRRGHIMALAATSKAPWQSMSFSSNEAAKKPNVRIGNAAVLIPAVAFLGLLTAWSFSGGQRSSLEETSANLVPTNLRVGPPAPNLHREGRQSNEESVASFEFTPASPEQLLAMTEETTSSASGVVVMADTGHPVSGVEVITSPQLRVAVSDQSGRFTIDPCSPGQQIITVKIVNRGVYVPTVGPIAFSVEPNEQLSGIVIPVTSAGVLDGVLTMDGKPLARQRVSVFYSKESKAKDAFKSGLFGTHHEPADPELFSQNAPGGQQWKRTDSDGKFRFAGLIGGDVKVRADLDFSPGVGKNRSMLIQEAKVETGATTSVYLDFLPAQSVITGKLFLNDEEIEHAGVGAKPAGASDDGGEQYFTDIDADGKYILEGMPTGMLQIWAYIRESDETKSALRYAWVETTPENIAVVDFDFFRKPHIAGYVPNLHSSEQATVVAVEGKVHFEDYFIPRSRDDLLSLNPCLETTVKEDGTFFSECPQLVEHALIVFTAQKPGSDQRNAPVLPRWGSGTAWPSERRDDRAIITLE